MAATQSRLGDQRYVHWVKSSLSLLYLKEGIQDFTDTEAANFHSHLKSSIRGPGADQYSCNHCTSADIKVDHHTQRWQISCRKDICNQWLEEIVRNRTGLTTLGQFPNLCLQNVKPTNWPFSPWEVCKVYMPYGCHGYKNARDADLHAILSLLKNCWHFQQCDKVGRMDLVDELLRIRNTILHSASFQMEEAEFEDMTTTMLDFLAGIKSPSATESTFIQLAVDKIIQLRTKNLDLSLNRDLELQALHLKQTSLDNDLRALEQQTRATAASTSSDLVTDADLECDNGDDDDDGVTEEMKIADGDLEINCGNDDGDDDDDCYDVAEEMQVADEDLEIDCGNDDGDVAKKKPMTEGEASNANSGTAADSLDQEVTEMETDAEVENELRIKLQEAQTSLSSFLEANDLSRDVRALSEARSHPYHKLLTVKKQHTDVSFAARQLSNQTNLLNIPEQPSTIGQQVGSNVTSDTTLQDEPQPSSSHSEGPQSRQENMNPGKRKHQDPFIESLQSVLIENYRAHCLYVPNPISDTDTMPFEDLYVEQHLTVTRETSDPRGGMMNLYKLDRKPAQSLYRDIFYTKDYKCRKIYIQGEAGSGKTMFCKSLINNWCKVHSKKWDTDANDMKIDETAVSFEADNRQKQERPKNAREEDDAILLDFSLLFYVSLKAARCQYSVIEMIQTQVFDCCEEIKHLKASELLQTEKCLVILDGLDDWKKPPNANPPHFANKNIPGRPWQERTYVFLTTTRPWAFEMAQIRTSDCDKQIELEGLDINASKWLCCKIAPLFNQTVVKQGNSFGTKHSDEVNERFLSSLVPTSFQQYHHVPFIVIQMVRLWYEPRKLGESWVNLYCVLLDMLLKRSQTNLREQTNTTPGSITKNMKLPKSFLDLTCVYCFFYQEVLLNMGRIAFEGMFDKERKEKFVFESNTLQLNLYGVSFDDVKTCLVSGILSQHKLIGKITVREKKMSFLNKNLQEFLAALHIVKIADPKNELIPKILDYYSCIESFLENADMWMFVTGLNQKLAEDVLEPIMTEVVFADERWLRHRNTSSGLFVPDLVQSVQTCLENMCREAVAVSNGRGKDFKTYMEDLRKGDPDRNTNTYNLPLEDIIISTDGCNTYIEKLAEPNVNRIKSVYVTGRKGNQDSEELLRRLFSLVRDKHTIEKLYINGPVSADACSEALGYIIGNANSKVTCLELLRLEMSRELLTAISSRASCLTVLNLWHVTMTHEQVDQVVALPHTNTMRELTLYLVCSDHGDNCLPVLDLSHFRQVRKLQLWQMCIVDLKAISLCMEQVDLHSVTISLKNLRQFVQALDSATGRVMVALLDVTVLEDVTNMVDLEIKLRDTDNVLVTQFDRSVEENTWTIMFHSITSHK